MRSLGGSGSAASELIHAADLGQHGMGLCYRSEAGCGAGQHPGEVSLAVQIPGSPTKGAPPNKFIGGGTQVADFYKGFSKGFFPKFSEKYFFQFLFPSQ